MIDRWNLPGRSFIGASTYPESSTIRKGSKLVNHGFRFSYQEGHPCRQWHHKHVCDICTSTSLHARGSQRIAVWNVRFNLSLLPTEDPSQVPTTGTIASTGPVQYGEDSVPRPSAYLGFPRKPQR